MHLFLQKRTKDLKVIKVFKDFNENYEKIRYFIDCRGGDGDALGVRRKKE